MFSKGSFFCALFLLCSFRFFLPLISRMKEEKKRKKSRAHTEMGRSRKKNRNNNLNVSCAFSIHLYAMHFSKCFPQRERTTPLLKAIEQSFHIEVHFSLARSLPTRIHFHRIQMQSTKDGFQIIKKTRHNKCIYTNTHTHIHGVQMVKMQSSCQFA